MVAISKPHRMTVDAYLAWEPLQELRYEFVDGEVLAMTGERCRTMTLPSTY